MLKKIAALILCTLALHSSQAQIHFPSGNLLNLDAKADVLYMETAIYFNTGKNKVSDYRWQKVSSAYSDLWVISSCFNATCADAIPDTGSFNLNPASADSTGFIAFHVDTRKYDGTAEIKYFVINKGDSNDRALLDFKIYYHAANGVAEASVQTVFAYPNPFTQKLFITTVAAGSSYVITTLSGQCVQQGALGFPQTQLDLEHLAAGAYLLCVDDGSRKKMLKILLQP